MKPQAIGIAKRILDLIDIYGNLEIIIRGLDGIHTLEASDIDIDQDHNTEEHFIAIDI